MAKVAVFLLAAVLSIAQGSLPRTGLRDGRVSASLWDQLVHLMQQQSVNTGSFDHGCFIDYGSSQTVELLHFGDSALDKNNACIVYHCTTSGVIREDITCPIPACSEDRRVLIPDTCCPRCVGVREPSDCVFTDWSPWTDCSKSCVEAGGEPGFRARRRDFIINEGVDSIDCVGNLTEIGECNADIRCPVFVSFNPAFYTVTEGEDDFADLNIVRSGDIGRTTVVTVTPQSGTAQAGLDFTSTPIVVTFNPGQTSAQAPVPIADDSILESTENFIALLSTTDADTIIQNRTAFIDILDNNVHVTFDPTSYTVTEGVDPTAQLFLVRSGDLSDSTTVTVTPMSGTAQAGLDFTSTPTEVTFAPGQTTAQVPVPITDDRILESTESFTASLTTTDPDVIFGDETAFVTILDNNVFVEFDPTEYTVNEGVDDFAELTVVRSGYLSQTTTVTVSFRSGTATAGLDFTSNPIVVTFPVGSTSAMVQVPITDDTVLETDEQFTATLSTTDPDVIFGDDTAIITILDTNVFVEFDPTTYTVTEGVDEFADITIVRSGELQTTTLVTVSFLSGTATAGLDFTPTPIDVTFPPGTTFVTVQVPIADDNVLESEEQFTATLSTTDTDVVFGDDTAFITILDNNVLVEFDPTEYTVTEGVDNFAELTLVRSGYLAQATTVMVTTLSGTATAGSDFTSSPHTVTFTPGATSAFVQVPITDDSLLEGTESFTATLTATGSNVQTGADTAVVTILDNDVFVEFNPTSYTVTEGVDDFARLTIVRSGETGGVTEVTVTLHSGTAVDGSDFTSSSPITVVFFPGQTSTQIEVPIRDDTIIEQTEMFTATLSSNDPNVVIGDDTATVTIIDNDVLVEFNPTAYTVTEGQDDFAQLTIVRSGKLSQVTTITFQTVESGTAVAGSDYQSVQAMVTFSAGETEAHVQVPIIEDTVMELTESFTATITTTENNVRFGADTATVTIFEQCDNPCTINGTDISICLPEGVDDPDEDCIPTEVDNCPNTYNPDQRDSDEDGKGDVCDDCNFTAKSGPVDGDGDGVEDPCDNCRYLKNPDQANSDGDETGDECDGDDDNDGIIDAQDNCRTVINLSQRDSDGDRVGDACDNCIWVSNPNQRRRDPERFGEACNTPTANVMESDDDDGNDDEKSLVTQIMEMLIDLLDKN